MINENEFIVKSLDEHTRNESILLLKDFRNIINIIVDLLAFYLISHGKI